MAGLDNDQPRVRFDPYVPQPDPGSTFGPHGDSELRGAGQPEADVWDFDPDIKLPNDAYRGVRRASAARPYRRVGLVIGVVVVVVAAAVALVIARRPSADTTDRAGRDAPTLVPSDLGAGPPTSPELSIGTPTGASVAASPVSIAAFAPLTFEAEAGPPTVKRRGADVETLAGASGGRVVRFTGGSGELEIRGVEFTGAGTYRITIYYVSEADGTAVVSMPNAAPLTVSLAGRSGCCAIGAVDVDLPSGQRTITISGVTSGVAIDKVVITRIRP
jgi:hypothetical protein